MTIHLALMKTKKIKTTSSISFSFNTAKIRKVQGLIDSEKNSTKSTTVAMVRWEWFPLLSKRVGDLRIMLVYNGF